MQAFFCSPDGYVSIMYLDIAKKYKSMFNELRMSCNIDIMSASCDELKLQLDTYSKRYDEICSQMDKEWFSTSPESMSMDSAYKLYCDTRSDSIINLLDARIRLLKKDYELKNKPEYGDVLSLTDFIDNCKSGGFIDYDGYGYYMKDGKVTDIEIYPSDINKGFIRKDMDGVLWLNR
mgnify:CR=1 FL=1